MTIMIMIIIQTQTLAIVSKYKPGGGSELNRTKQRWLLLVHLCFNMISRYGTIKYIRGNYQINHEFNRYGFQRHSQTKSSYPIITRSRAIDRPVAKVIILVVKQSNYKFSKPINSVWWINNKAAYSKKEWTSRTRAETSYFQICTTFAVLLAIIIAEPWTDSRSLHETLRNFLKININFGKLNSKYFILF